MKTNTPTKTEIKCLKTMHAFANATQEHKAAHDSMHDLRVSSESLIEKGWVEWIEVAPYTRTYKKSGRSVQITHERRLTAAGLALIG